MAMAAMNMVSAGGFSGVCLHLRRCPQGVASVLCKKTPIFGSRRSKLDHLTVRYRNPSKSANGYFERLIESGSSLLSHVHVRIRFFFFLHYIYVPYYYNHSRNLDPSPVVSMGAFNQFNAKVHHYSEFSLIESWPGIPYPDSSLSAFESSSRSQLHTSLHLPFSRAGGSSTPLLRSQLFSCPNFPRMSSACCEKLENPTHSSVRFSRVNERRALMPLNASRQKKLFGNSYIVVYRLAA
jgi:hypothetical protein